MPAIVPVQPNSRSPLTPCRERSCQGVRTTAEREFSIVPPPVSARSTAGAFLQDRGADSDDDQSPIAEARLVLERKQHRVVIKLLALGEQPDPTEPKKKDRGNDPEKRG